MGVVPRALVGGLLMGLVGLHCADTDRLVSGHGREGTDAAPPAPAADAAGSCSQDLLTDPRHCGRCGHDCLGGACEEGQCQPVAIATAQVEPALAGVDGTHVYWVSADEVMGVPKSGGTVVKPTMPDASTYNPCKLVDVTGSSGVLCIAIGTSVFSEYELFELDKAGGAAKRLRTLSAGLGAATAADVMAV